MPSVVLRDSENRDAGFILLAGKDPTTKLGQRDVIFMRLPLPNESPLAKFVQQHKNSEFSAYVTADHAGSAISFSVADGSKVTVRFGLQGKGVWSVSGVGEGTCEALP